MRFSLRRFCRDRSSIAAVEFAIITPVMLIMLLATIEATLLIRLQQKLNFAAGQLAELIAAQPSVTEGSADGPGGTLGDMCTGVSYDLLPFNPSYLTADIELSRVRASGNTPGQDWEVGSSCPTASTNGADDAANTILTPMARTPYSMFTPDGSPDYPNPAKTVINYGAVTLQLRYTYTNIVPFILGPSIKLSANGVARPRTNATITCTYPNGASNSPCPGT